MPGRSYTLGTYRYGFNGKENDDETSTQDYGLRIYNPALGRFLSVDPLSQEYPFNSTYAFAENSPIENIDLDGAEKLTAILPPSAFPALVKTTAVTLSFAYNVFIAPQVIVITDVGNKINTYMKNNQAFKNADNAITGHAQDKPPLKLNQQIGPKIHGMTPYGDETKNNDLIGDPHNSTEAENPGEIVGGAGGKGQIFRYAQPNWAYGLNKLEQVSGVNGTSNAVADGVKRLNIKLPSTTSKPKNDDDSILVPITGQGEIGSYFKAKDDKEAWNSIGRTISKEAGEKELKQKEQKK